MRYLALMLLLIGCDAPTYECEFPCVKRVYSDLVLDCDLIRDNVSRVIWGFEDQGITSAEDACDILGDVEFKIQNELYSWYDKDVADDVAGIYWYNGVWKEIQLPRSLTAMAHEALHAYEDAYNLDKGGDHIGWAENKQYQALMKRYEEDVCSLSPHDNLFRPHCW